MNTNTHSTLIEVNEHLTVSLLAERNGYVLCQNIENGEFVTWARAWDGKSFCNGHYTFSLEDALEDFNKRAI